MSESNGRCEFEHLDYCCPPRYIVDAGFKCTKALPIEEGDIAEKCGCPDNELLTEEEWECLADGIYDKMKSAIDDWEMKGYRRK